MCAEKLWKVKFASDFHGNSTFHAPIDKTDICYKTYICSPIYTTGSLNFARQFRII